MAFSVGSNSSVGNKPLQVLSKEEHVEENQCKESTKSEGMGELRGHGWFNTCPPFQCKVDSVSILRLQQPGSLIKFKDYDSLLGCRLCTVLRILVMHITVGQRNYFTKIFRTLTLWHDAQFKIRHDEYCNSPSHRKLVKYCSATQQRLWICHWQV